MGRVGVYGASRVARLSMWHILREQGVPIISTWIDEGEVVDRSAFLDRCLREVAGAERLVWYVEASDFPFKIAWGEVCVALFVGVPVIIVAGRDVTDEMLARLPEHRLVRRVDSITTACTMRLDG